MRRNASTFATYTNARQPLTIGIRREDPSRLWERRCPLTPKDVRKLVSNVGVEVLIQPCEKRVFRTEEFLKAGARIHPTLEPASIILGIKEVPLEEAITSPLSSSPFRQRTHLMFSHTAKGQAYNLPLLSRFLDPDGARLIDYELIVGEDGKRTIGFGWFAGVTGLIEGLCASAHDALAMGVASPFLNLPRPYSYRTLSEMRTSLASVGNYISELGMPAAIGPFVVGITGNGKVSNGALDMIRELPIVEVETRELEGIVQDKNVDLRKVYLAHILPSAYLFGYDKTSYDRAAYYAHPSLFHSEFHLRVAPYLSLLINGAGWKPGFPRLMSNEQLRLVLKRAEELGRARFRSVADISCDFEGGLEFVTHASSISDPFYTSKPASLEKGDRGVQVMSIDILPTELPLDSSEAFSHALMPYLRALIAEYRGETLEVEDSKRLQALKAAAIASGGKLLGEHQWLYEPLQQMRIGQKSTAGVGVRRKKRVLMLGSGMVAKPAADEFLKRTDVELVVASNDLKAAQALVAGNSERGSGIYVDISDSAKLGELISETDVVVSLLPASLHPIVAEHCINHHKHLITASYVSSSMQNLHSRALEAGVLLLSEMGLDPGLDHMSAVAMRKNIEAMGRKVISFTSWCGGLPAPEDADVPFGMKFSWSPKGLLTAALNSARFKRDGEIHEIPGSRLLSSYFPDVRLHGAKGFALEGLANRDSFGYASLYGLGNIEELEGLFRGTLRYKGFSSLLDAIRILGFLDDSSPLTGLRRWSDLTAAVLSVGKSKGGGDTLNEAMYRLSQWSGDPDEVWRTLQWLSIVPSSMEDHTLPPIPTKGTPLDLLTVLLAHKLRYLPNERDMVILSHEMISVPRSSPGTDRKVHTSTLVTYSNAMARTVGLPLAFGALRILDGHVSARGVRAPVEEEIYAGVLSELESVGIKMKESMA